MEMENVDEFSIPKEMIARLADPEVLRRFMEEGKTFQEILDYSEETMNKFYSVAYNLFQNHRYRDSADAFLFLTTLNPYVSTYWLGLGMCEQINEEYKAAIVAYTMAHMSARDNPLAHYHIAACHHALNEVDSSLSALEITLQIAGSASEHEELRQKAQKAKDYLASKKEQGL